MSYRLINLADVEPIPRGLCRCGCGGETAIARDTNPKRGSIAGEPVWFLPGHACRLRAHYAERDGGYETACWQWLGRPNRYGYAKTKIAGQYVMVHRWSWQQENGPIPDGLELDHLCRNRACVNPAHLEPVAHPENVRRGTSGRLGWFGATSARIMAASTSLNRYEIADVLGVKQQTVSGILAGDRWA